MGQLDDELALFVFLTALKGVLIFPAQGCLAVLAVDICYSMQAREQDSLLRRTTPDVDHGVEEVSSALAALEGLGDELVVVGQVSSAVDAAVGPVAAWQVGLKSLGARHSDHGRCWRAVQEGTASPGRLTGKAPQHTGEGRGGRWVGRHTPLMGRKGRFST